jgi:hypothetical protein
MDLANAIQSTSTGVSSSAGPDIVSGLLNVALFAIFAAYGYWLLRYRRAQASKRVAIDQPIEAGGLV